MPRRRTGLAHAAPGPRVDPLGQAQGLASRVASAVARFVLGQTLLWFVGLCIVLFVGLLVLRGGALVGAWPVLLIGWGSGVVALFLAARWDDDPYVRPSRNPEGDLALALTGVVGWALLPAIIALVV